MEILILYFVLFFPGVFASPAAADLINGSIQTIPFSVQQNLVRTLVWSLPSLALLWYLITDKKGLPAMAGFKPEKRDLLPFSLGLCGLFIIGLGISFSASFLSDYTGLTIPPKIEAPVSAAGWMVMVFTCLGTGYLEESYFRYYLLMKLENTVSRASLKIAFSTLLFSLCHAYEGPWGIFNSVLAGVFLSLLFIRYRSLHGIAWAHAGYNMLVYIMAAQ